MINNNIKYGEWPARKEGERKKVRDLQHTGRVEFSVLQMGTELVNYTDETNKQKKIHKIDKMEPKRDK